MDMCNFNELAWRLPGFGARVQEIGATFGREFALPPVHQLGIMVADVQEAAAELERQGMAPFFIARGAPRRWQEDGAQRAMEGALAITYREGVEVELLEPGRGSNWYRESLAAGGPYSIQHLGYLVEDVDAMTLCLQAAGFPLRIRGCLAAPGLHCEFAYVDTREAHGLISEFIDLRVLGLRLPPAWVYRPLARLQRLLGVRCFDL
ncbi:VOC family protein [Pseudomonas guguanensis]|uniref:VOC family protein n=1 Tax=Ectopseudomonas guguanensis TaxID=1198456 RepID=UPI0032673887